MDSLTPRSNYHHKVRKLREKYIVEVGRDISSGSLGYITIQLIFIGTYFMQVDRCWDGEQSRMGLPVVEWIALKMWTEPLKKSLIENYTKWY